MGRSVDPSAMAISRGERLSKGVSCSSMKTAPSARTETVRGSDWSGMALASVLGSSRGTPTVSSGAETMKTISSTSITSTRGVTLISDRAPRRLDRRLRRPPPAE